MLDVNEMLMMTLCPNRRIMAKEAEKKENSLKDNELSPSQNATNDSVVAASFTEILKADCEIIVEASKFPVKSFPEPLQEIILQTQKSLLFPSSYMGTSILYTASVAIGNTHWVQIKKGFQVPCVLYCALVGKVGARNRVKIIEPFLTKLSI